MLQNPVNLGQSLQDFLIGCKRLLALANVDCGKLADPARFALLADYHQAPRGFVRRERLAVAFVSDNDYPIVESGIDFREGEHGPVSICPFRNRIIGESFTTQFLAKLHTGYLQQLN